MTIKNGISKTVFYVIRVAIAVFAFAFFLFPANPVATYINFDRPDFLSPGNIQPDTCFFVVFLTSIIWATYWKAVKFNQSTKILWWLSGIYLAAFVATYANDIKSNTVAVECTSVTVSIGVGLTFARLCGNSILTLKLACVVVCILALNAVYDHAHSVNTVTSGTVLRAGGPTGHPLELAYTVIIILPILIQLSTQLGHWIKSVAWLTGSSISIACLILTVSRCGIAAGLAACVFVCVKRQKLLATFIAFSLICLVVNQVRSTGPENLASTNRSNSSRLLILKSGWRNFSENWLTGIGPGELNMSIPAEYRGIKTYKSAQDTNNLPIMWLTEFGIGGLVFLAFFVHYISSVLHRTSLSIRSGMAAAWIAIALAGIFDVPFGTSLEFTPTILVGALLGATLLVPIDHVHLAGEKVMALQNTPLSTKIKE